ncbi:MAG TPA: acetyl-CoA carboxylase biotin carboxyl carrier protein, partial [Steroidobacteraceae bacterium]|nr:acetyl-CoA carboxylase biotin carboxyl carrier protein [Steroidobacteraceae bacterium]
MDIRKIKKLIELLEESGIAEIEIKEGEEAVRISRMPPPAAGVPLTQVAHPAAPAAAVAGRMPEVPAAALADAGAGRPKPGEH